MFTYWRRWAAVRSLAVTYAGLYDETEMKTTKFDGKTKKNRKIRSGYTWQAVIRRRALADREMLIVSNVICAGTRVIAGLVILCKACGKRASENIIYNSVSNCCWGHPVPQIVIISQSRVANVHKIIGGVQDKNWKRLEPHGIPA